LSKGRLGNSRHVAFNGDSDYEWKLRGGHFVRTGQ
jgi:hypothetical protein